MDGARRVIKFDFNPRFLSYVTSYDVASTIHQSLVLGTRVGLRRCDRRQRVRRQRQFHHHNNGAVHVPALAQWHYRRGAVVDWGQRRGRDGNGGRAIERPARKRAPGRGLHSSTFQLNLSRFGHTSPYPPV